MAMTIDGNGSITGLVAGGLPDATITQPELASGVSGTGPAFSAYQSSAQTISSATFTKILFQTEEFDTNNNFASSRFTPTVAGYYQVSGGFTNISITPNEEVIVALAKNGAVIKYLQDTVQGSVSRSAYGSGLIFLNGSTDYVELFAFIGFGGTLVAISINTWFTGCLVRGA